MTFYIGPATPFCTPVVQCNDLPLPTSITATFEPLPPTGCAGCARYGVEHYGCQRVDMAGDPEIYLPELIALLTPFVSRALLVQLYQRAMDLARGVFTTDYALNGGNVSQTYGPWGKSSIGANAIVAYYDSDYDADPRQLPGGARPYGVARLDGPLSGREWVIDWVDTSSITTDSQEHSFGPWTIYTLTPLTGTALANAATSVAIFAYTSAGAPQNPAIIMPGTTLVDYGGTDFLVPGNFTDPAAIPAQAMMMGPRFCLERLLLGVAPTPGNQASYRLTSRGLGLDTLAGESYQATAAAGIVQHDHDFWEAGWGGAIAHYTDGTSGAARVAYLPGLQVLRQRLDSTAVDLADPATWPALGPAAGHQVSPLSGFGDALDATTDPHGRARLDPVAGGSRTAHRYDHSLGAAYRDHPRYAYTRVHFPLTASGPAVQTMHYGTIQWGTFDLDAYMATIYAGQIRVLRPHDYDCTGAFPSFAQRRTATIKYVETYEDGTAGIYLEHGGETLLRADGTEIDVLLGGNNVALPQHWLTYENPMRCNNPASGQCTAGDGYPDKIEAGDRLSFDNEAIPEILREIGLGVISVQACCGPRAWNNPSPPEGYGYNDEDDDAWWTSNVASLPGITGEHFKYADKVTVNNENGFLGGWISTESLIGVTLPFLRSACVFRPGTLGVSFGNPESTFGDDAISGALKFAAAGLIYLPTNLAGECLIVDGDLLTSPRLTSVDNFWAPWISALRGVMGVRTFVIHPTSLDEDGIYYGLDSYYDDFYYQDPAPSNAWREGTTYYWYSENPGSGTSAYIGTRLETASPYNDRYSAITEYYNPMVPFWSADLHRFPWTSDAVTEAYAELAVPDLTIEKDLIELQWSETEIEGWNCYPLGTQGLLYCARYTMAVDVTEETPLTISLLGVNDTGGVRTYTALAAAGGGGVDAGTNQAYDVTELVKEMMNGRNTYDAFMLFLGVEGYTVTPDKIVGKTFMKTILGKTYKREGSVVDGSFVGTIEATRIRYGSAILSSGVMGCDPDNMPLGPNEAPPAPS